MHSEYNAVIVGLLDLLAGLAPHFLYSMPISSNSQLSLGKDIGPQQPVILLVRENAKSVVIMRSNLSQYYTQHCDYSSRKWIRLETHNRHPIAHPNGWAMGCFFVKILEKTDHVIAAPHCILLYYRGHVSWNSITVNVIWFSLLTGSEIRVQAG